MIILMYIRIFILLFSLLSFSAFGDVDLKNGNFFYSWIDAELASKNFFWQLQRTYNSRENRVGYFGHGWCSPLETKLTVDEKGKNTIRIQNCGSGESVVYSKDSNLWKNGDQTITIMDEMYVVKVKGITHLQFNQKGDLDAFWLRDEKAKLKYTSGKLSRIETAAGALNFTFDEDGKVSEIATDGGTSIKYTYSGNDLSSVTNIWNNDFSYTYDKFGNMTSAAWPDKTSIKLAYNARKDWVTSLTDRDGCSEKYRYESKKSGSDTKISSSVHRTCGKKSREDKAVEIVYDNSNNIKNIKQSVGHQWKEIAYNSFSKPAKISDYTGVTIQFDYDKDGNLIQKKNGNEKTQFVLNDKKQVSQVISSNSILNLEYDERGRVNKVNDLKISYVDQSEKLKTLELSGSGQINYTYDSEGRVSETSFKTKNISETDLQININRIYGTYTTLTDESALYGGLD